MQAGRKLGFAVLRKVVGTLVGGLRIVAGVSRCLKNVADHNRFQRAAVVADRM